MAEIRNTTGGDVAAEDHSTQTESYVRKAEDAEKVAATADPDERSYLVVRDRKFMVKENVPTHLGMKIAAAASDEDVVSICGKWAPMIIEESERDSFDRFMIDASPVIHDKEYMDMFTNLMEIVGGRPTKR